MGPFLTIAIINYCMVYGRKIRTRAVSVSIKISNLYHCEHTMLSCCLVNMLYMTEENGLNNQFTVIQDILRNS